MELPMEGHIAQRFDADLTRLHMMTLEMGGLVLDQVDFALQALRDKNLAAANLVIRREPQIDTMEVDIDNEAIAVIAIRAPVARDLRITTAVSKTVTDLERIADEAARVAELTITIYNSESSAPSTQLLRDAINMGRLVHGMLKQALDIFDTLDANAAEAMIRNHGDLDAEFQSSLRRLTTFLLEDARNVGHTVNVVLILKALERIGDHARNIAEYVIYFIKGKDIRHQQHGSDK